MADKKFRVVVSGDNTGAKKAIAETGTALGGLTGAIGGVGTAGRSHFASLGAAISASGVNLGPLNASLTAVSGALDHIKDSKNKIAGIGAAVGVGLAGLGGIGVAAAAKDEKAHAGLKQAIENTGGSYEEFAKQVEGADKKQEALGHTHDQTEEALTTLVAAYGNTKDALAQMDLVTVEAAKHGGDLAAAADLVAKIHAGKFKALAEWGVNVTAAGAAQKDLTKETKASAQADTAAEQAKQRLADIEARLGVSHQQTAVSAAGLTSAQDTLNKAIQHQADMHTLLDGKVKLTAAEQIQLRNADQAVEAAKVKLTAASDAHSAALDAQAKKAGLTIAQQQELRNAQAKAFETTTLATEAHRKLTEAQAAGGKAMDENQAKAIIMAKGHGIAEAQAKTFGGHMNALKATVEDAAASLGEKYGKTLMTVGPMLAGVSSALPMMGSAVGALVPLIASPVGLIVGAIALIAFAGYEIVTHWKEISKFLGEVWGGIASFASDVWNGITGFFKQWWPEILGVMTGGIGIVVVEVIRHWGDITSFFSKVPGEILGFFTGVGKWLEGVGKDLWDGMIHGVNNEVHFLWDFFTGIPKDLGNMFSGALHWLEGAGGDILKGLANGLLSAAEATVGHIPVIGKSIIEGMKAALGTHSPSTIFAEIGGDLMAGLALGIDHGVPDVHASLRAANSGILTSARLGPMASAALSSGAGGSVGGVVHHHTHVTVNVAGHVMTDRDLGDVVHRALLTKQATNGTLGFNNP